MFKNMKLGVKISMGFGVLILIAILLGGIAIYNMKGAEHTSNKLAMEYVPEVKIATDLRGAANRVMYQMRGYAMTDDHKYYEAAQEELTAVDEHLKEATDLAEKAIYLKALKGHVEEAKTAVANYKKLVDDTAATNVKIEEDRKELDEAAAEYMENAAVLLEHQNELMKGEIGGAEGSSHGTGQVGSHAVAASNTTTGYSGSVTAQPCPAADNVMSLLAEGNGRYLSGNITNPNSDQLRRTETVTGGQHPRSTVLACSDSRVPVETLFDQGIGDVFPVRVAGNVVNVDELGSIEYGVDHLETPLLVVLGHTGCGAVTAKATNATVHGSIPALLENITPAVEKVRNTNPGLHGDSLIGACIEENVWNSIEQVLTKSSSVQQRAKAGKVKVVGAIYNLESGKVEWLGTHKRQSQLLAMAVVEPSHTTTHATAPMADNSAKHLERLEKITLINDIIDLGNATRIGYFRSQALRDPKLIEKADENFGAMDTKFAALYKITRLKEDIEHLDKIKEGAGRYKTAMNDLLKNWLHLQDIGTQREEAGQHLVDACKTTADAGMTNTNQLSNEAASSLSTSSTIMTVGLIVALIIGSLLAFVITRGITKPINRIIAGLTEGSEQVSSASGQVSAASQSLAEGATEQAAGLEETSSSLEEMSSMTKQNAENAAQANNLSSEARKAAESGNESMGKMSSAIQDIQKSSEETAKIIKVIDEIAFQTNLLALNAAVEAARAGEAGKGFAVVAEEVRNLAMRSAEAAKNTSAMIEESVKNSQNGVAISKEVAASLQEIVTGVGKATDLVGEIAAASQEQAQGIDQINTAMSQMDKVTQQNAANAEESASASEELSAQAEQMNGVVAELAALVGGSAGGNGQSATSGNRGRKHLNINVAHPSSSQGYSPSDKAFHQIAGGKKKATTKATAEKVIPLHADGDDDFDEFNA